MSNKRRQFVGLVILYWWAHVMFWLYVGFMMSNAVQWVTTGNSIYLRSMGVHLFTASASANVIMIFAEWRGVRISPRWSAPVLSSSTWMFLVGLLIISGVAISDGDELQAIALLVIGGILALMRYSACKQRAERSE